MRLPDHGPGFVRARPGEGTNYAIPRLVRAIQGAAASVVESFPGGPPLRVGDLSYRAGGRHPRHRSHRTGRDVDIIFYATGADGEPIQGRGWVAYDLHGIGREPQEHGGQPMFLDVPRNWHLVRTLLLDKKAQVQWIFCSAGVKARLLEHAIAYEPIRELVFRAAWVLHEPSRSSPHDDHFHVRIACGARQRALGCIDRGPLWPWWTDEVVKQTTRDTLDDRALVRALLLENNEPENNEPEAARAVQPGPPTGSTLATPATAE